jgi:Family of unknown function (DUF6074)
MTGRLRIEKLAAATAPKQPQEPILHVEIAPRTARVLLMRGRFRGAEYIQRHVGYVVAMGGKKGEEHIGRNLYAIERKLRQIGIDEATIAAELQSIEGAVRAELWRQILTPDGCA